MTTFYLRNHLLKNNILGGIKMNKKLKTLLSVVLTLALGSSLLAGCSSSKSGLLLQEKLN